MYFISRYYVGDRPQFPVHVWNKHAEVLGGLQLTNNVCEVTLLPYLKNAKP
jgi:hypothetical protein